MYAMCHQVWSDFYNDQPVGDPEGDSICALIGWTAEAWAREE